jgi:hypothetical protein
MSFPSCCEMLGGACSSVCARMAGTVYRGVCRWTAHEEDGSRRPEENKKREDDYNSSDYQRQSNLSQAQNQPLQYPPPKKRGRETRGANQQTNKGGGTFEVRAEGGAATGSLDPSYDGGCCL